MMVSRILLEVGHQLSGEWQEKKDSNALQRSKLIAKKSYNTMKYKYLLFYKSDLVFIKMASIYCNRPFSV